jgi:hypothetical protein
VSTPALIIVMSADIALMSVFNAMNGDINSNAIFIASMSVLIMAMKIASPR